MLPQYPRTGRDRRFIQSWLVLLSRTEKKGVSLHAGLKRYTSR